MFMPVINEKDCSRCRECAKICPKAVFDSDEEQVTVSNPKYCTGCESCTAVCPNAALKIEEM